ncbi:hypothetical protein GCM10009128_18100 [Psychrosphaera haliotis]
MVKTKDAFKLLFTRVMAENRHDTRLLAKVKIVSEKTQFKVNQRLTFNPNSAIIRG